MSDLIDRQQAIDYFVTNVGFHDEDGYPIEDECELREIWTGYFDGIPSAQPKPCEDAVSREAAVAKVNEYASIWMEYTEGMSKDEIAQAALDSAKQTMNQILSELPSVTPKQRTGKWIKTARWRNVYKCDQCGNYLDFSGVNAGRGDANFCPNCGSRNEVTE